MRRVGEAFYGRAQAYDAALAGSEEALAEALARNVYAGVAEPAVAAVPLAAYVRQAADDLAGQPLDLLAGGTVRFPEPASLGAAAE
jgi:cytochrome b pre-mRNA-processing protein 3